LTEKEKKKKKKSKKKKNSEYIPNEKRKLNWILTFAVVVSSQGPVVEKSEGVEDLQVKR
jgi:hypothetical protein